MKCPFIISRSEVIRRIDGVIVTNFFNGECMRNNCELWNKHEVKCDFKKGD